MVRRSQYSLAGTLLKTCFFKQVSELKIQREKLGSALRFREGIKKVGWRILDDKGLCSKGKL